MYVIISKSFCMLVHTEVKNCHTDVCVVVLRILDCKLVVISYVGRPLTNCDLLITLQKITDNDNVLYCSRHSELIAIYVHALSAATQNTTQVGYNVSLQHYAKCDHRHHATPPGTACRYSQQIVLRKQYSSRHNA